MAQVTTYIGYGKKEIAEKAKVPAVEKATFSVREVRYPAEIGSFQGRFAYYAVSMDNGHILGKPFPIYTTNGVKGGMKEQLKAAVNAVRELTATANQLPSGWLGV